MGYYIDIDTSIKLMKLLNSIEKIGDNFPDQASEELSNVVNIAAELNNTKQFLNKNLGDKTIK